VKTLLGIWAAVLALAAASVYAVAAADKPVGDPVHGKSVYQVCMGCHSLDEDDVGPRHRGVVGRMAGSVPGYAYSPALRNSHIVWNSDTLDRWLTNPQALVPGAKMFFAMPNPSDRADVIAYLAEQR
jgi:cytochrome c